jgi:NADPH:quinone reductase
MRAVVVPELAGPDALRLADVDEPEGAHPQADGKRLLVEVHTAGVAFPDLLQSRGEYQIATETPFVSGGEVAGVVVEAPAGSGFALGDRVAGMTIWGAMAELALAIPKYTVKLPEAMSYAEGAALYLNYATAWFAVDRVGVRAGETVLVQGAAGGVGTAALDVLRGLGARSSPATRRSALRARWAPTRWSARPDPGSTKCAL